MNKKHIIEEIKRTAKENNGKPLGKQLFENETGIKYTDWFGKYWTKWSDAQREAGYEPSKWKTGYDKNFLIEQLIFLIRNNKDGKFPTLGDIRMERSRTKSFPSSHAFDRLGTTKSEKAKKILAYCKNKSAYQDVVTCCRKVCEVSKKKEEYTPSESETEFGFVYLMRSGRYYKIGRSTYVEKRNYEIGIKLPEPLNVIHKIKTDDPTGIEAYWHKRFEEKRVRKNAEWFDLSSSDVKAFKRRKFQ